MVDTENARIELRSMHERGRHPAIQLEEITAQQAALASDALQLCGELDNVYRSTSSRTTRPLRALASPRRTLRTLEGRRFDRRS